MYHVHLHIRYFHDHAIQNEIRKVLPEKQFTYLLQAYEKLEPNIIKQSDILIAKYEELSSKDYQSFCKKNAILIVCVSFEQLKALPSDYYTIADDIWVMPLSSAYVEHRLTKLLHQIKQEKDKALHEQYLDTLIDSMPDMVWFKDNRGIHLKVNQAFCHTVEKTREDVTGKDHCYIWNVPREEFEKGEFVCNETEDLVRKLKKTCRFDEKVKSKGELRQFHTYKSPIFDEFGQVIGTVGIGHDITDLQNMSTELEIVLGSMPFAILVKNENNVIINVNEKFIEYFKVSKESLLQTQYDTWKDQTLNNITKHGTYDVCVLYKDKEELILEYHEEPIYDIFNTNVGQLCIFRDITIELQLEKQILLNSNTDFMTGLYNRRYLYEYMNQYRNAAHLCLLYIDLDTFKKINDTYGHQIGDMALLKASQILQKSFHDDFTARIGGDEFLVIMMKQLSEESIKTKVQAFIQEFQTSKIPNVSESLLSACVGITTHDGGQVDLDHLIKQADAALYCAKQAGKGNFRFYQEETMHDNIDE